MLDNGSVLIFGRAHQSNELDCLSLLSPTMSRRPSAVPPMDDKRRQSLKRPSLDDQRKPSGMERASGSGTREPAPKTANSGMIHPIMKRPSFFGEDLNPVGIEMRRASFWGEEPKGLRTSLQGFFDAAKVPAHLAESSEQRRSLTMPPSALARSSSIVDTSSAAVDQSPPRRLSLWAADDSVRRKSVLPAVDESGKRKSVLLDASEMSKRRSVMGELGKRKSAVFGTGDAAVPEGADVGRRVSIRDREIGRRTSLLGPETERQPAMKRPVCLSRFHNTHRSMDCACQNLIHLFG